MVLEEYQQLTEIDRVEYTDFIECKMYARMIPQWNNTTDCFFFFLEKGKYWTVGTLDATEVDARMYDYYLEGYEFTEVSTEFAIKHCMYDSLDFSTGMAYTINGDGVKLFEEPSSDSD